MMLNSPSQERGTIYVPFMFIAVLMSAAVLGSLASTDSTRRIVNKDVEQEHLENLGNSLVTLSGAALWEGFMRTLAVGDQPTLSAMKNYLDVMQVTTTIAPPPGYMSTFEQGGGTEITDYHAGLPAFGGNNTLGTTSSLLETGFAYEMGLATDLTGGLIYAGANVLDLDIERRDVSGGLLITISTRLSTSAGSDATSTKLVRQSFVLAGEPFTGLEFGLLANNVNCIMCHATFDRTDRAFNRDPALYGTFPGVQVGALESMKIRSGSADSVIAGSFYTTGVLMDKQGGVLASLAGTTLDGFKLDAEGNLIEDAGGNLTAGPLNVIDESGITDGSGQLPSSFPSVIPDTNGNRAVDASEFQVVAEAASGTLSGATRVSIPQGSSYAGVGLPSSSNMGPVAGTHSGNLVLVGTPSNPIQLNGRIAIDGDLAISGVVQGSGSIIASGNIYVLGSMTYADGTAVDPSSGQPYRTYGTSPSGGTNQVALGAGGNILVGDYLSTKKSTIPVTGLPGGGFNFTLSETTLFNRREWTKTQQFLPGPNGTTVKNPVYDPKYTPRYYTFNPGDPVFMFIQPGEHYFDPVSQTWMGKEHMGSWTKKKSVDPIYQTISPGEPGYQSAVITALNPTGNWLSTASLMSLWGEIQAGATPGPFQIDAMLYTNNSIMTIARSTTVYQGQMTVNGGIVAADVGILVAGLKNKAAGTQTRGLRLNYDTRLKAAFSLRASDNKITFSQAVRF